ncbi:MAG: SUMF1/EgtB/PvdO family nonheme iron enzyme [Lentisphaeria bacterium]|nr:SUMF1/EgtB/PvdO family nonheme iron enzyme [Lentisphaeria bacterium]
MSVRLKSGVLFAVCGIAALLIAAAAGLLYFRSAGSGVKEEADRLLNLDRGRPGLTGLQIQTFLPELTPEYERKLTELKSARAAGEWKMTEAAVPKLRLFLQQAAEKLIPALPEKTAGKAEGFAAVSAMRGYLSSPLAAYLDPETASKLKTRLAELENDLYRNWRGLRCEGACDVFPQGSPKLVFVPPGAARSPVNGETVKIAYAYWIGRTEVTNAQFYRVLKLSPRKSVRPELPATHLHWNDILFYCAELTRQGRESGLLPPGYIIRPMTEAEWEFATANAWLGEDSVPLAERAVTAENSGHRISPPASRKPGRLGVYDLCGNAAEIVLQTGDQRAPTVIGRGGSYQTPEKNSFRPVQYPLCRNFPYDAGFRVVAAPGTADFFDRHFFTGGSARTKFGGKIFELLGGGTADGFTWDTASELCRLLGGCLAELPDPAAVRHLKETFQLGSRPVLVGGLETDGKWRWQHGGQEIRVPPEPGKKPADGRKRDRLTLFYYGWHPVSALFRPSLFLCEWDERDHPRRNEVLRSGAKLPLEKHRFTVGGRAFLLIESDMSWYSARRFCELLGGRLACLDTPELERGVKAELKRFRKFRILLGGYAKRDRWFWLSGRELTEKPQPDDPVARLPDCNRNYLVLKNGSFRNGRESRMFLCEWPSGKVFSH